jgi:hypothetical protein
LEALDIAPSIPDATIFQIPCVIIDEPLRIALP